MPAGYHAVFSVDCCAHLSEFLDEGNCNAQWDRRFRMNFDHQQLEEHLEVMLVQDVLLGWQVFGPGHYRLNGQLDVWPFNRKYHNVMDGERGEDRNLVDLAY